jgi:hypothetical protein
MFDMGESALRMVLFWGGLPVFLALERRTALVKGMSIRWWTLSLSGPR